MTILMQKAVMRNAEPVDADAVIELSFQAGVVFLNFFLVKNRRLY
jgi:hypothetical protein